ncbi:MAG: endolytic transglycosylase MltG [Rhizobiaceae bacterium]
MSSNPANPVEFGRRATPPSASAATPQSYAAETPTAAARPASEALRPAATVTPSPAGTRRSRGSRNQIIVFMNFLMSLIVFVVLGAGVIFFVGKRSFEAPGPSSADTTFVVRPNSGVQAISTDLEDRGLISSAWIFSRGVAAYGNAGALKAGEYEVKAGASMHDIMDVLESGKSLMYSITIPEGLTVDQAWQRVAEMKELSGDMPQAIPDEGTLAADTQRFTRGTPRQQIIDKMLADQKKLVASIWETRTADLPLADINEFVTLASIVEKETGIAAERPQVAAVFINRLNKGMRLQSDPTIIYGLFGGKGKPADRPIYQSDIKKQTPYNTYVIDGLPPTPIANPGRAALEAVANPAKTNDLYFVADGTGGHVFAATLEDHNKNVAKWRALQKDQAGAGEEAEGTAQ